MHNDDQSLIFEMTKEGRIGYSLPELDVPELDLDDLLPAGYTVRKLRNYLRCQNLILCAITQRFLNVITVLTLVSIH